MPTHHTYIYVCIYERKISIKINWFQKHKGIIRKGSVVVKTYAAQCLCINGLKFLWRVLYEKWKLKGFFEERENEGCDAKRYIYDSLEPSRLFPFLLAFSSRRVWWDLNPLYGHVHSFITLRLYSPVRVKEGEFTISYLAEP